MATKKLYIDVTQLVHWDKSLAGIPRVMHELAVRFYDRHEGVQYVSWVKEVGAYCLVDYEQSVLRRGNGIKYLTSQPGSQAAGVAHPTPPQAGQAPRGTMKRAAKKLIGATRRIHPALPERIYTKISTQKAQSYVQVSLSEGDAVFIGWGEWWDGNFLTMLEESHKRGASISTIIHDVGPMITPHLSGHSSDSLANYCYRIVPICDVVMVNSQFTKKTLIEWLNEQRLNIPPISVFVLGDDFDHASAMKPRDEAFIKSGLKGGDYIMTVGTVELKKNHIFLYYVYYLARERGIDLPKLVIVGRRGWGSETNVDIMMNDPALKDKFVFLFDTSDEELAWLYENARHSVFPSFYEGWGIPVAESLFRGVPVISSRASSLAEVGGDKVERFSPASTDECLSLMVQLMDEAYYARQKAKVKGYVPATWDQTYEQTVAAMRKEGMIND